MRGGGALVALLLALLVAWGVSAAEPTREDRQREAMAAALGGKVHQGVEALSRLLAEADPRADPAAYWSSATLLLEVLQANEVYPLAEQVLKLLIDSQQYDSDPAAVAWLQYYLGRNLDGQGKTEEAERYLRALTGGDPRLVFTAAQRRGAMVLAAIAQRRGAIGEADILMRRVVIGTWCDGTATSLEIAEVLSAFATHQRVMRRPFDSWRVMARLEPIYRAMPRLSPQRLRHQASAIGSLLAVGNLVGADRFLAELAGDLQATDVVPPGVGAPMLYFDLLKLARAETPAGGAPPIAARLAALLQSQPDLLRDSDFRLIFAFVSLVAGDSDAAARYLGRTPPDGDARRELAAYHTLLRAAIAMLRSNPSDAWVATAEGFAQLRAVMQRHLALSADRAPSLTWEERLVLSLLLARGAKLPVTDEQAELLLRIGQALNREKAKLGLDARLALQGLPSALQREDARSRDRLHATRDRLIDDAIAGLVERAGAPGQDRRPSDFQPLVRLEEIEDKIDRAERRLPPRREVAPDLATVRRLLRPDEVLVTQTLVAGGVISTCIGREALRLAAEPLYPEAITDEKLLVAAVRAAHPPSATLDHSFPGESAYRLYRFLFGGIAPCLAGARSILLATDPDLFALPWQALLTAPMRDGAWRLRDAHWLPRSFAISLLPSVGRLQQLRTTAVGSRAQQRFLGIGDPDFAGPAGGGIAAGSPAFTARDRAQVEAIRLQPRLPQTAVELQAMAAALGDATPRLLLGAAASERRLRAQPLDDFQVISFATHAVVADELDGVGEPGLLLSPGEADSPRNDGLLTASEIANLSLDANLVVLSACNTAAPDGRAGGRGLSGLADALFFAGARGVVATQWAVFSDAAQRIGTALAQHAARPDSAGAAEDLRLTMLDDLAAVAADHLAHPRFWAAFVVAGDGATKALTAPAAAVSSANTVELAWQSVAAERRDSEIVGLAVSGTSGLAVGIDLPEGRQRAGSFVARLDAGGTLRVLSREEAVGAGPVAPLAGGDIAAVGTSRTAERRSAAVLRRIDPEGRERWRFVRDRPPDQIPAAVVPLSDGLLLVLTELDSSAAGAAPALAVLRLSLDGAVIGEARWPAGSARLDGVVAALDADGRLIVAMRHDAGADTSRWLVNPTTGSRWMCLFRPATELLAIDPASLALLRRTSLPELDIRSLRRSGDKLYAAAAIREQCHREQGVAVLQIDRELGATPLFQRFAANDLQVAAIEVLTAGFVLIGSVRTQLPAEALRRSQPLELPLAHLLDEAALESGDEVSSAFVLAVDRDGHLAADQVFLDNRRRSLNRSVLAADGTVMAGGMAYGERAWVVGLRPPLAIAGSVSGAAR